MQFQRKALHTMLPCKQHFTLESKRRSFRDLVLPAVSLGTAARELKMYWTRIIPNTQPFRTRVHVATKKIEKQNKKHLLRHGNNLLHRLSSLRRQISRV